MAHGANGAMRVSIFSVNDHHPAMARTIPQLYGEVMDQCRLAEGLGYDTFFCAEHHFHEYGVVPDPAVMLSAIAQQTDRIRLGTAISILTFHDPRRLAETYSMVDMMSGGRLVYGVGSGYLAHEFEGYDEDPAEKRDKFNEHLDIIKRLMAGERLSYEGKFTKSSNVALNVLPHEGRVPPIYVAVLARPGAYHVGKQGNRLFTVPYASCENFEDIGTMLEEYRKGRAEADLPADDDDHVFTLHVHVAKDEATCHANVKEPYDLYVATRLYAASHTYEDILENGICLFGDPDHVADKMFRLWEMGIRHVACLSNFGNMKREAVEESMRLMMEEVMPKVEARIAQRQAA
jgi:alkanesulfonate monooxygenase SsuD/methylene tetrahydromethanopterin reductase-like flavin-dependent oxidoreductase (luciferase family)